MPDGQARVAIVTGAGQGIGRGVALALTEHGYQVVVVDRHEDRAQETVEQIEAAGVSPQTPLAVTADLLSESSVQSMIETVIGAFGGIDVMINNAGALRQGGLEDTTIEMWDAVFDGCVKTAWLCTRAALPALKNSLAGRVINISSIVAQGADSANLIAYTSAKRAVEGLTVASAREVGQFGITVNAICPGSIETPAWDKFPDPQALRTLRASQSVIGRVGRPSEIGEAAIYLASPGAGFVTGQILVVDGGRTDKL